MGEGFDLKKEWGKAKKQIAELSQTVSDLAKKGEKEVLDFSQRSMLQIDSTALGLKMEHLYYLIGKEYVQSLRTNRESVKLRELIEKVAGLEAGQKKLLKQMGASRRSRRAPKSP